MHVLKKTLKRVAAGITGAAVIGMTLTGALAVDQTLADFPKPFTGTDTILVVGSAAATEDTTAREDIATSLATLPTTTSTGGGELTFETGELEDMQLGTALNNALAFGTALDDTDDVGLIDGAFNINIESDEDYDYHEDIIFDATAKTTTALVQNDEEFGDKVILVFPSESIVYNITFEDALAVGNYISDSTPDNDIDLKILGKDLSIRGASTAAKMTAVVGDKVLLNAGDKVKVGDHTVVLKKVSDNGALLEIDGEAYNKAVGGTTLDKKGVEVYVDAVYNEEDSTKDSAILIIGNEAVKTYADGNAFWDEDETYYLWEWNLANLDTAAPTIGVTLTLDLDDPDDTIDQKIVDLGLMKDNKMYLVEGDYLCLPHKYACVVFDEILGDMSPKQVTFDASDETKDLYPASTNNNIMQWDNAEVISVKTVIGDDKGFIVNSVKTNELAIYQNATATYVYYLHKDSGKLRYSTVVAADDVPTELFTIDTGDFTYPVYGRFNCTGGNDFNITVTGPTSSQNITFGGKTNTNAFDYFGAIEGEDTGSYYWYGATPTAIDSYSNDVRTLDGVVLKDPESGIDSDKITILIPDDDEFKVNIRVAMPVGGAETTVAKATTAYTTMLDTEVTDVTKYDVIAVGGPAVNKISAQLLGVTFPAYGTGSGIKTGEAIIDLKPNGSKWALVVAGWEAENTLAAASVLKNSADYTLKGASVAVKGTVASGVTVA